MTSVELHLLWEVLLSPGWCLLTVTVALGSGGLRGKLSAFFPFFFFCFMFGFEILLFFQAKSSHSRPGNWLGRAVSLCWREAGRW